MLHTKQALVLKKIMDQDRQNGGTQQLASYDV